jgi:phospholipid-binding lipoprotein MlaA
MKFAKASELNSFAVWFRCFGCLTLLISLFLAGCASGPNANPADPFEPLNRSIYKFNDVLDQNILKPVATTYREVTPTLIQRGITNFFSNLEDIWSIVNNVLQFKAEAAAESLMRVSVNTVMGFCGILDIASEMGIDRHTEDFGQTLGYWGVGPGPFVVIPVLGPSTLRDATALVADTRGDAVTHVEDIATRNSLWTLRAIDYRAAYLKSDAVLDEVALDKYSFIRDGYLQRRRNLIYDGNPPDEEQAAESASAPQAEK